MVIRRLPVIYFRHMWSMSFSSGAIIESASPAEECLHCREDGWILRSIDRRMSALVVEYNREYLTLRKITA